jgi:hypothetical protein
MSASSAFSDPLKWFLDNPTREVPAFERAPKLGPLQGENRCRQPLEENRMLHPLHRKPRFTNGENTGRKRLAH